MKSHISLVLISIVAGCHPRSFNVGANTEAHTPSTSTSTSPTTAAAACKSA